jgi:hypothetical protein
MTGNRRISVTLERMTSQLDDKPQAVASQLDIDTRAPASPGVLAIFGLLPAPGFW